jgi:coniferyl-aldehyde dehydrogenase
VTREVRVARLQRVIDLVLKHHRVLTDAMSEDFGGRSRIQSLFTDIGSSLACLKFARDKLGEWMVDERRQPFAPYDQLGAEAWVMYQPKGSVGILGAWNTPLLTLLGPLASVLAAGNRAILKPSESAPRTADAIAAAFAEMIDPLEVTVITGGPDVAQDVTRQPFAHLVFTGSAAVGKLVMRNAAENLVPVTLELGGKSPTLIGRSADLGTAAFRIALAKTTNGGQLCINADIVYVPQERVEEFLALLRTSYEEMLPSIASNSDVTPVINARQMARIEGYIADAAKRGLRIESLSESVRVDEMENRRRGLRVVVNPGPAAEIMKNEIFGPALVVRGYERMEEVVADVASREHPLALYYFGADAKEQAYVLGHTLSGGACINEVLMHGGMEDAPFGGIGGSGMGCYRGREGFNQFSHVRTVFKAAPVDPRKEWGVVPPYPQWLEGVLESTLAP